MATKALALTLEMFDAEMIQVIDHNGPVTLAEMKRRLQSRDIATSLDEIVSSLQRLSKTDLVSLRYATEDAIHDQFAFNITVEGHEKANKYTAPTIIQMAPIAREES